MLRALVPAVLALALPLAGCDVAAWLERRGARTIREVDAAEARRLVDAGAALVQLLRPGERSRRVARATAIALGEPLPAGIHAGPGSVVVVAQQPAEARRLAARLARAGIQHVIVVRGGPEAWEFEAAQAGAARRPGG